MSEKPGLRTLAARFLPLSPTPLPQGERGLKPHVLSVSETWPRMPRSDRCRAIPALPSPLVGEGLEAACPFGVGDTAPNAWVRSVQSDFCAPLSPCGKRRRALFGCRWQPTLSGARAKRRWAGGEGADACGKGCPPLPNPCLLGGEGRPAVQVGPSAARPNARSLDLAVAFHVATLGRAALGPTYRALARSNSAASLAMRWLRSAGCASVGARSRVPSCRAQGRARAASRLAPAQ